jgi:hypothetical protein
MIKPKVIYNDKWLNFWGFGLKNINGMTILPFIILREQFKENPPQNLINHESIHIQQQVELLLIGFALIYYINWLVNIIKYKITKEEKVTEKAYRNIILEKEAYDNDDNLDYLKTRKCYAFLRSK